MKNFYEATVTKPQLTLECCLGVKPTHGDVNCLIKINGETKTVADHELWFSVSLDQPIDISIQLIDRQHPDALAVTLTVDGHEVLPRHQHLANPPTCYIDTNNIWHFSISNFYPWLHENTGQGWII